MDLVVAEIKKLQLSSHDLVIIEADRKLPVNHIDMIRDVVTAALRRAGHANDVLVMDGGLTIKVVRKEDKDELKSEIPSEDS